MKQNRSTLYLILACLFALALPLFDYLEYIQFRQAQLTYQYGYLQLAIRPLILPMCSLFLGWFLVHFLGIQKTNRKIFFLLVAILIIYIIFISPWCLIPILQLTLPWPDYINYLAIIFSQIDFLPAIFVIMGMGLAYTR